MDPIRVVVVLEFDQLACQVHSIPEEYPSKVLPPDRSDQPFDERMREGSIWHRLDLLDLQNAQVGEPAVEAKQRIVVGTEVFRFGLFGSSVVEHPADRDAINVGIGDAEADNAASEDVHDEQHPMAAQQDGFNPEQIGTPETVLEVANECQPGRAIGPRCRSKVFGKYAAHDIFVDLDAKGVRDLLGDAYATEARIAPLHLDDDGDELRGRTFGTGFAAMRRGRKEQLVLMIHQRPVKLEQCSRLDEAPSFTTRRGLTNSVVSASTKRSIEVRFGARCLERVLMSS